MEVYLVKTYSDSHGSTRFSQTQKIIQVGRGRPGFITYSPMLTAGPPAQGPVQRNSEHTQGLTLHGLPQQLLLISDCCHREDFILNNELEFPLL